MEKKVVRQMDQGTVRTIITNAIYGKAIQTCNPSAYISFDRNKAPSQVLGCVVKNAQINTCRIQDVEDNKLNVKVEGSFNVHVWYEMDGDTQMSKTSIEFSELIPVRCLGGEFYGDKKSSAWIVKAPNSLRTMIVNKSGEPAISVQVGLDIGAEVVGEAKIDILSYAPGKTKAEETSALQNTEVSFDCDNDLEDDD